jgi:signal transduction histidine kinase
MARADLAENELILALERERAEGLEPKNEDLIRLQQTREQFPGMVTHELRTPLTSISAFTDILGHNREGTLTDRQFQQPERRVTQRNYRS